MQAEDFVRHFADCFTNTPPADITESTRFRDLEEWGSMMALIVIAMIDADYGVTITGEELRSVETVGALMALVQSKM